MSSTADQKATVRRGEAKKRENKEHGQHAHAEESITDITCNKGRNKQKSKDDIKPTRKVNKLSLIL